MSGGRGPVWGIEMLKSHSAYPLAGSAIPNSNVFKFPVFVGCCCDEVVPSAEEGSKDRLYLSQRIA